jgi:hypothetical protein
MLMRNYRHKAYAIFVWTRESFDQGSYALGGCSLEAVVELELKIEDTLEELCSEQLP